MSKPFYVGGNCYAVTEALYHILGGAKSGWEPMSIGPAVAKATNLCVTHHWFLKHKKTGLVIDASKLQFKKTRKIPYDKARRQAFLTKKPSARAKDMMAVMTWVQPFKKLVEGIPK